MEVSGQLEDEATLSPEKGLLKGSPHSQYLHGSKQENYNPCWLSNPSFPGSTMYAVMCGKNETQEWLKIK
jgi:hypothetical protein